MHELLARQLQSLDIPTDGTRPTAEQWQRLLERVDRVYRDADLERSSLERTISHSSSEMRALHDKLEAERDRLRAILESAALGILSVDADDRIIDANPAATRMLGLAPDQLVGRSFSSILDGSASQSLRPPRTDQASLDEHRYAHPNGRTAWFHATRTWVHDHAGIVQLDTVVLEDITEKKILEGSLRHAQKLEAVGRLAAGIAHEINTPVQFVSDNVHFLKDSFEGIATLVERLEMLATAASLDQECRRAAEEADWEYLHDEVPKSIVQTLDGLQRVASIVHSMKNFAHTDRGEQVAADLNAALSSTLTVARHEYKNVAVAVTDFGDIPPVVCSRGDLNQVFLNLIVNAAHTIADVVGKTGELGRITVATRREGEDVVVSIADTGAGIPEAVAAKIFDPFFTTKDVGRGSGQGLALARQIIVNKHQGSIWYETRAGAGTTFFIRLPIGGATASQSRAA